MAVRILNVAEKPKMAKGLSRILGNGQERYVRRRDASYMPPIAPRLHHLCLLSPPSLAPSRPRQRPGHGTYNGIFEFPCNVMSRQAQMTFTSVSGHLMEIDFTPGHGWSSVAPVELFTAPIEQKVRTDMDGIERTLLEEARKAQWLVLWLDCDREGENIAYEVVDVCKRANPRLRVLRAKFSALIPADIMRAVQTLVPPDHNLSEAVAARSEIDLRLGAAFTRFQTLRLQVRIYHFECMLTGLFTHFPPIFSNKPQSAFEDIKQVVSYGPCQFPTLGFVVERWSRIQAFVEEQFWSIQLEYRGVDVEAVQDDEDDGGDGEGDDVSGGPTSSSSRDDDAKVPAADSRRDAGHRRDRGGRGPRPPRGGGAENFARFAWKRTRLYVNSSSSILSYYYDWCTHLL